MKLRAGLDEVYDELDDERERRDIEEWSTQLVDMKYAFEIEDVPREAKWIKITYPYDGERH
jgi:hypothetical protein